MQGLKQSIEKQNCFEAALHLAQYFQSDSPVTLHHYVKLIEDWAEQAKSNYCINRTNLDGLKQLLEFFYVHLAFSGDERHYFSQQHSLVNKVIDFRTGVPVSLALVFEALAKRLGFVVSGINFPGHFLIKVELDINESIYIDPNNGKILALHELEALYFQILGEIEQQKMPPEALLAASCEETIVRLIHNLKATFINNERYQLALRAVELLVDLCPNDPYERRDRGFLLHQLDCPQLAVADYQYFIQQCPKDPAIPLLSAQVKHLAAQPLAIFH